MQNLPPFLCVLFDPLSRDPVKFATQGGLVQGILKTMGLEQSLLIKHVFVAWHATVMHERHLTRLAQYRLHNQRCARKAATLPGKAVLIQSC